MLFGWITQEPLGLPNFWRYFWVPRTIYYKMHIIFQKGVDNFEIERKTCSFLVSGAVPPLLFHLQKPLSKWLQSFINNGLKNVFGTHNYKGLVWSDFSLPMSASATVTRFNVKLHYVLIGYFMLPLLMLTSELQNLSIHSLISICSTCWWHLNKIVFELQSVDAILEDVSAAETIIWCWAITLKVTIFQCSNK